MKSKPAAKSWPIDVRSMLSTKLAASRKQVADLLERIARTDLELARADARPVRDRVLEDVARLEPEQRGKLLEELARLHRQASPGSLARDGGS